jgi:hypothetical protein
MRYFPRAQHALYGEGFPMDEEIVNEEVLEGQIYEESYQEDQDEFSHVEYLDETFDEYEVLIYPGLCSSCTSRREHDEL